MEARSLDDLHPGVVLGHGGNCTAPIQERSCSHTSKRPNVKSGSHNHTVRHDMGQGSRLDSMDWTAPAHDPEESPVERVADGSIDWKSSEGRRREAASHYNYSSVVPALGCGLRQHSRFSSRQDANGKHCEGASLGRVIVIVNELEYHDEPGAP